jgi:hypothetical protein
MVSAPASRPADEQKQTGEGGSAVPLVLNMDNIPNSDDIDGSDVW